MSAWGIFADTFVTWGDVELITPRTLALMLGQIKSTTCHFVIPYNRNLGEGI